MKFFKSFVVLCLCCLFLIPDRVYADGATYYLYDDLLNAFNVVCANTSWYFRSDTECRLVCLNAQGYDQYNVVFAVFESQGNAGYNLNSSVNIGTVTDSIVQNGHRYYYLPLNSNTSQANINVPIVQVPFGSQNNPSTAVVYTFGSSSVDPAPPLPDYGQLLNVKFSTSIAGSGSAAINNIDHITWNAEMDSNGIQFDGTERVQIKAIAGNYTDSSRNGLLGLGVTDFDYNSGAEHMLAEYPATRGYYDVSWSHVIQQLNAGSISDFLNIRKNDDVWLKSGWIYKIRLVVGEYQSEWITIYNATSSGVENSLTIENSTELNMTLVNTIQQINNINQSVTNWEIDNTTINMENQDGTETTDKPWWAYLLEAIVSLMNGILGFLGNLIGDLIDAIVSLFQPSEFTINNFNEYKLELKQNSGIFGQAIDFTTTLKNTFMGVQYQDPVLHWQGISFGETVFIPAADYNLNDYVTMWGLGDFRTMAYLCSDGFIYFSLLILIVRKLNEVLKK